MLVLLLLAAGLAFAQNSPLPAPALLSPPDFGAFQK
jgi:hypothetical protein